MNTKKMLKSFCHVGRDLFVSGAITSHGGNLSASDGKSIWITKTGVQLGRLRKSEIIETTWDPSDFDLECSSELVVHRAMYHALAARLDEAGEVFGVRAIVHAHTLHTTFQSLYDDEICSVDSECKYLLPNPTPVVSPKETIGSAEAADMLADVIRAGVSMGIIRGHGPFAIAPSLEEALQLVSSLEHSCTLGDLTYRRKIEDGLVAHQDAELNYQTKV